MAVVTVKLEFTTWSQGEAGRRDCNDQTLALCHEGFDELSDKWFCLLPNEGYIITAVEFAA